MPATSALMPGCAAGLYINTGSFATPVWSEVLCVKDVKVGNPWDFTESRSRATPLKLYAKTGVDLTYQAVLRSDPADLQFQSFVTAAGQRTTTMDLLILNAKNTVLGAVGVAGPFLVSLAEAPQDIDGTIYFTFDLKPSMDSAANIASFAAIATGPVVAFTVINY